MTAAFSSPIFLYNEMEVPLAFVVVPAITIDFCDAAVTAVTADAAQGRSCNL